MVQLKGKEKNYIILDEEISIPHGTIKRGKRVDDGGKTNVFQYLMVQLKASVKALQQSSAVISIPHGTIKRVLRQRRLRLLRHFNTSWYN